MEVAGIAMLLLLFTGAIAVPWAVGQRKADRLDADRPVRRRLPPNVIDLAARRGRRSGLRRSDR